MRTAFNAVSAIGLVFLASFAACSGASDANNLGGNGGASANGGSAGVGGNIGGSAGTLNLGGSSGGSNVPGILTGTPACDKTAPNYDDDKDGFTIAQGDCNECTPQMNPGAYDYPGNGVDEDCNGTPDDEPAGCDNSTFDVAYADPKTAARAMGLCRDSNGTSWGLVEAKYVKADGSPGMADVGHGLLSSFGPVQPRDGISMLALSSGTARRPGDPGWKAPVQDPILGIGGAQLGTTGPTPGGYPIESPACVGKPTNPAKVANDPAALELTIKVPTNANQFGFDFDFYTTEYPGWICNSFNDFFIALVDPTPPSALAGNISFDSQHNPVSVNNGFLEVCQTGTHGGKAFPCKFGTGDLIGTGYDTGAATNWLNTVSPAPAGQTMRIRFAIWDAGDHLLDSLVLIDHFTWTVGQGDPTTKPIN